MPDPPTDLTATEASAPPAASSPPIPSDSADGDEVQRGAPGAPLTEWTPQRLDRNVRQFMKFGLVGASGVVVNLAVFNLTMWAWSWLTGHQGGDLPLAAEYLANALGFAVSVFSNYVINRRWTFRSTASKRREMPRFYVVSATAYAVNLLVFHLCRVQLELPPNLSQLLAIACVTPINFVFNKLWSFR